MKLWLPLIGAVIVAAWVVVGVGALAGGFTAPRTLPPFTPRPAPTLPAGATPPLEPILAPSASQPTFVINGVPIYLPDDASWTDFAAVTDFGGGQPPPIVELRVGESWVRFDKVRGTLLERDVMLADQATLQPLIKALDKPMANDVQGALPIFAAYLSTVALPKSIDYVETTAGEANALFEPTRVWGLPPDAPVWAIVARGTPTEADQRDNPYIATVWVVVAKGVAASIFVGTDDRVPFGGIDLTSLGAPVSIPPGSVPKP